jgi:hypothetical protein
MTQKTFDRIGLIPGTEVKLVLVGGKDVVGYFQSQGGGLVHLGDDRLPYRSRPINVDLEAVAAVVQLGR